MMGIVTGIIKNNWDEDHPGQVQVEYTLGEEGVCQTGWIPVMTPYAGTGYGIYLLPEMNTEVVLGFHSEDPRRPIVLGCLWNQVNQIPEKTAAEENDIRLWKSKTGYCCMLDETQKLLSISDPAGEQTIEINSDDNQGTITINGKKKLVLQIEGNDAITVEDGVITIANNMKIQFETVTVEASDMKIDASTLKIDSSTMEIDASTLKIDASTMETGSSTMKTEAKNLSLKATVLKAEATSIEMKASTSATLKANATATVESSGMLQIKGQILKLN